MTWYKRMFTRTGEASDEDKLEDNAVCQLQASDLCQADLH